jgi:hypothetical protein
MNNSSAHRLHSFSLMLEFKKSVFINEISGHIQFAFNE